MLLMAIDQRRAWVPANHVEASAHQRKILLGEVNNAWRFWDAAIEPRLDGMAVRRGHIDRLRRHQRTDVVGDERLSGCALGWGADYSPVSNIGDIWSLEEGADESSIVLDIDKVGLNAFLQQFV